MPITKLTPENNTPYLDDRLQALQQAVPEAFADGKINWDTLRETLGEELEEGGCEEYFGLNWPGKREARKRAAIPSRGTLVPAPGEGVNEDETENLFIEGDNLEVLKLLQKSYAGKIKMIYIDPPYNTGNDFIYNDDFADPLEEYLEYTGAKGEGGELLTTNTRADGRFHSKWLSMMYPRLILAKQLLRNDGVIFVSIDDNEAHHLRQMMNEVFGEENYVAVFPWKKRTAKSDVPFGISQDYEWILCFAKSDFFGGLNYTRDYYTSNDYPNDRWRLSDLTTQRTAVERPNSAFNLVDPKTKKVYPYNPNRIWGVTKNTFEKYYLMGKIVFPDDYDFLNLSIPSYRVFESEDKQKALEKYGTDTPMKAVSTALPTTIGRSEDGTKEITELFGNKVFSYPKPVSLINFLATIINNDDCIVLDFFAGSCTTAQSIFEQNYENKTNMKFILVQLPEKTTANSEARKIGYETISEIGRERIKRAIQRINKKIDEDLENTPLLPKEILENDIGFRVFEYNRSNFKCWKPIDEENINEVVTLFDDLSNPLIEGWKKEDLLTEILLLEGLPLTSKLVYLDELTHNEVYRVSAPGFCAHELVICLDNAMHPATLDLLELGQDDILVCLDSALTDELKARLQDQFNVHVI